MNARGVVIAPGTIRFERLLPGPIERIWDYLTEPDKPARWFCGGAMEPRVGGRFELEFDHRRISDHPEAPPAPFAVMAEGIRFEGRITAWDPPHRLAYVWIEGAFEESEVTFELTAAGERVRLVVTHCGLGDAGRVSASAGWHTHLDILEDDLGAQPRRAFWAEHSKREKEYGA